MIFEDELKAAGFIIRNTMLESTKVLIYDYSDFEVLECTIEEHTKVNGEKCLAVTNLRIYNSFSDEDHDENIVVINYTLYFDNINKFYDLLTLLNYRINVK